MSGRARVGGARRGSVLILSLVLVGLVTVIVGSLGSFYVSMARTAQFYLDQTYALIQSAQASTDGTAMNPIQAAVLDANAVEDAKSMTESLVGRLEKAGFKKTTVGGSTVYTKSETATKSGLEIVTRVEGVGGLTDQAGGDLTIVTVVKAGGIEVMKVRETVHVSVEMVADENGTGKSSHPIFNFAYFANNYGHLEAPQIIVNGDVGANGDFTVSAATVNGYVKSAGEVYLYNQPKMWPRVTYMKRVADEFCINGVNYFTQVRPTDPIVGSANGAAYRVAWPGGYVPPDATHSIYGDPESPNAVADPGAKPQLTQSHPKRSDYTWPSGPTLRYSLGRYRWSYDGNYYDQDDEDYVFALYEDKMKEPKKSDYPYPTDIVYNGSTYYRYTFKVNGSTKQYRYETTAKSAWQDYYNTADRQYNSAVSTYTSYRQTLKNYKDACDAYTVAETSYKTRLKQWEKDDEDYRNYMEWYNKVTSGNLFTTLTASTKTESGDLVVSSRIDRVEMPDLSDRQKYIDYCRSYKNAAGGTGGSLTCENLDQDGNRLTVTNTRIVIVAYKATGSAFIGSSMFDRGTLLKTTNEIGDKSPAARKLSTIRLTGGYDASIQPFEASSDSLYAAATEIERGSVVLIGSMQYPIIIDGPVYIEGDVIIRGFVKGQGSIYAGRNIHIVGDISYLNPPSWPHGAADLTKVENKPDAVKANNATRDLLSLNARGNIIIGDYASQAWTNASQMAYLKSYGRVDPLCGYSLDPEIGYTGGFDRDYTQKDGCQKVAWMPELCETIDRGKRYEYSYFESVGTYAYYYREKYQKKSFAADCCYYESKLGGALITELKTAGSASTGTSRPTSWLKQLIARIIGLFTPYGGQGLPSDAAPNPADVTEIDGVLFANHGIFGVVGGSVSHKFQLNGGMVCRDEGLLPSFAARFASYPDAKIWINWDMRVASDSAEGNTIVGINADTKGERPVYSTTVVDWQRTYK